MKTNEKREEEEQVGQKPRAAVRAGLDPFVIFSIILFFPSENKYMRDSCHFVGAPSSIKEISRYRKLLIVNLRSFPRGIVCTRL